MKFFSILVIFLFLSACNEPSKNLTKLSEDAVILAFGDSLTYGTGASSGHDYPNMLAGLTQREVINEGVPGEISDDGLERLPQLLDDYRPQLLILIHGGNDMLRKLPDQQTTENLKRMIAEASRRHIDVVIVGVPKPNLLMLNSAEFYRTLAESEPVLADFDTLPDILGNSDLKSDMIHPNDAGYRLLAENIFNLLQQAGAL